MLKCFKISEMKNLELRKSYLLFLIAHNMIVNSDDGAWRKAQMA